jgi:hypothetical protein
MNESFVCIKVDREERPDLDEIYMAATVALSGSGGWPMTVFLTPDQRPFFAGTYFPPTDKYGRPGFPTLLGKIRELWHSEREGLLEQAAELAEHIREQSNVAPPLAVGLGIYLPTASTLMIVVGTIVGYFYDDHDQTNTASMGLTYEHHGTFFDVDGEYGSGYPFGDNGTATTDPTTVNFLRLPSHFIVNAAVGFPLKHGQIAFTCNNIANHGYILKQAGPFTDTEWGQGRTLGIKITQNF